MPNFVAKSYDSLPPSYGFDLISSTLVDLISQISSLKTEVTELKKARSENNDCSEVFSIIKDDIFDMKLILQNINCMKSAKSSDHLSKDDVNNKSLISLSQPISPILDRDCEFKNISEKLLSTNVTPSASALLKEIRNSTTPSTPSQLLEPSTRAQSQVTNLINCQDSSSDNLKIESCTFNSQNTESYSQQIGSDTIVNDCNNKLMKDGGVDNKGLKSATGKLADKGLQSAPNKLAFDFPKSSGSLKSAQKYLDLYLGNCDLDITVDIVKGHIFNKTGIKTINCEQFKLTDLSKSFKVTTFAHEREKLLNNRIWPPGIICRKFYNKNKRSHRVIYNKNY